jgi:hypothetical protein
MFNREKIIQQLKMLFNTSLVRIVPARVLSIESNTCKVLFSNSELIFSGITHFTEKELIGELS